MVSGTATALTLDVLEFGVGECKMKMEAIKVNEPTEFERPGVKRGGGSDKLILLVSTFLLIANIVVSVPINENMLTSSEKMWLKKIQNEKSTNRSKILKEIEKKAAIGEVRIRGQFRKELILLLRSSGPDYEIEITNLLMNTVESTRNKEPIVISFTIPEIENIKRRLKSKKVDDKKEAVETVWRMGNLRANGVLQEENIIVEIDIELLTEAANTLKLKDADLDLKVSEILQSENTGLLKQYISPLLDSASSTVKVRVLLVLAGDDEALDKHIEKVILLAKNSDVTEIKDLAILMLCKKRDPVLIDAVKTELLDVTDVMNNFREYIRTRNNNAINNDYLKSAGFYLARKDTSCKATVDERVVDANEIPQSLNDYSDKNIASYSDVEFVWDRLVQDSAGRHYIYPLYTRTDNRNYWHSMLGANVTGEPIIEIAMKMTVNSSHPEHGNSVEICRSNKYSLLLLVKNNRAYIVGLFQNKE